MYRLDLVRVAETQQGVFGALVINDEPFCVTLEPPDKNNQACVSCIPPGMYNCERYSSKKYPNTWEIRNVRNRSNILIHAGNTIEHTLGCILLAEHYGKLKGQLAVLNSGNTFKKFQEITKDITQMQITIHN